MAHAVKLCRPSTTTFVMPVSGMLPASVSVRTCATVSEAAGAVVLPRPSWPKVLFGPQHQRAPLASVAHPRMLPDPEKVEATKGVTPLVVTGVVALGSH